MPNRWLNPVGVADLSGNGEAEIAAVTTPHIGGVLRVYRRSGERWSDTDYVRRLLSASGVGTSEDEVPFSSWGELPDLALLSIKHYQEDGKDFWHWVVFKRVDGRPLVLDSASYLPSNIRTDFENMHPKWFIEVNMHSTSMHPIAGGSAD
ncbi:hypothetical protein CR158_22340 [Halomonas heilongjiangensis]|uniref:VCBS repeat-containing protein n=2 Tax=Halomonas heilongjiangensis TaxID=1387883 RepID=A0A2N7TK63_9GAMM|nr:hypothetical protein C1H66_14690 [Halomonas heilongjiangensis]PXX86787.1 hypothetical protein CR158_22340 [Halomonas heilongjiangensis]